MRKEFKNKLKEIRKDLFKARSKIEEMNVTDPHMPSRAEMKANAAKLPKDKYVQYYQRKGTAVLTDEGMLHYKKVGKGRTLFALATLPIMVVLYLIESSLQLPAVLSLLVLCYGLYCLISGPMMWLCYIENRQMRNDK